MLAFFLSIGLFTIILVNNVTFCQTKRYKIYNGYIIKVVEVKAFGINSLYPDFRVFDSLMISKVGPIAIYYRNFINSLPLLFLIYSLIL